jgi:ABC-type uncharacterized transport system involved in gliding motility auxiliary subunit
MKSKPVSHLAFSAIGVAVLLLVLVAVNYVASFAKTRVDLTADRVFTLSDGTRQIVKKLDTPVTIRLYATRGGGEMPEFLKNYAQRVEDLLAEYRQLNPKNIVVQKLDPQPDSDAEDSARLDGVEGQQLPSGERLYLGLSISQLDQKEAIPFLDPRRERQLEYDLTRAISSVMTADKPVIGVISPLSVAGMGSPMMMQMGQPNRPAWVLHNELKRAFKVQEVDMAAEKIPDEIKVLLVIHPKALSPGAEFALDQFVLRGGKLIAFLDPLCVLDTQQSRMGMGMTPPSSSTFDNLLKAWGVTFNLEKIAADMTYAGATRQGRQPAVLALGGDAFSTDDIVTADADNAVLAFAGVFSGTSSAGLKVTPLITTSENSQLVEGMMAQMSGDQIASRFAASGEKMALAIRLTGKFKTAFPNGKPAASPDADKKDAKPDAGALKESAQENTVLLFGDADFIQDPIAVDEIQNPFGGQQRIVMPTNGNLALAQSAVEQMAGDNALIALRSRGVSVRPFTLVRQMQERAEASYRGKIQELEESLRETESRISQLQQTKDSGQKFILSPEQQKEIANFRKKEADARKELKTVRRSLRSEIDSLENRLKWLNIAAMPALVAVAGIIIGLIKRQRAAAR